VEINGEIARSCITYAVTCDGAQVRSIEGFDDDPLMAHLRQAFTREHALQCGYCTPGMLIAARDLARRKPALSRSDIRSEMSGNLCRCTGYMGIVNAIERVMAEHPASVHQSAPSASGWLGPAPGPVAMAAAQPAGVTAAVARPTPPQPRAPVSGMREPIRVAMGEIEEVDGRVRLAQSFRLEHPRDSVWRLMSDPEAVARCMPGAALDGPPHDGRITGRIEVKLGPVTASFAGEGTVQPFPADFRQVIEGRGGDRKSGSRVSGSVDYRLTAIAEPNGSEHTRVDVAIGYALTGLLAQFGRSNLARDLAGRMGETFAQNIDAQLRGAPGAPNRQAPIGGASLVLQVLAARLRALFRRILGP
jgi:carbon-monoxide dehydrogenase small subunit